jgi:hypothetical protein
MVVPVTHNRGERRLPSALKLSVFGDGLLERARSTSFALLGVVAAIGLGMVAFVLNQGWPVTVGGPLPGAPAQSTPVGGGAVALGHRAERRLEAVGRADGPRPAAAGGGAAQPQESDSDPPPSLVVATSRPAPPHDRVPPSRPHSEPKPVNGSPSAPEPAPSPASSPTPSSASPPQAVASSENQGSERSHGKGWGHGGGGGHGGGEHEGGGPAHPPTTPSGAGDGADADLPSNSSSGDRGGGHGNGHGSGNGHSDR